MSRKEAEEPRESPRRRHRWRRRIGVAAVAFLVFLVWLNGPGVRWIGGIALRKVLAGQGIGGEFTIRGTILGGLSLEGVHLRGGPVVRLDAEKVGVSYRASEIIHGRARALHIHGLKAIVDLDALPPSEEKEPEPFDPAALAEKIRNGVNMAYQYADPVEIDVRGLAVELRKGETPVFAIGPTSLAHTGHAAPYQFSLGEITHVLPEPIPAQEFAIDWSPQHLRILPFDPLPRLSVRDVNLSTTEKEKSPLVHLAFGFEGRQLEVKVGSDAQSADLRFIGDPLAYSQLAKGLRLPPPADFDAELRALSLHITGIDENLADWTATLDLAAGNIAWREWSVDAAEIHVEQNLKHAEARWKTTALGGTLAGTARTEWPESAPLLQSPVPPNVEGTLNIAGLNKILTALGKHIKLPKGDLPFPCRSIEADWSLDLAENQPAAGTAKATLAADPASKAPPIRLDAAWTRSDGLTARLETPSLRLDATMDSEFAAYHGKLRMESGAVAALSPWFRAFTTAVPKGLAAAVAWQGSGDLKATPPLHKGNLELASLHLPLPDQAPVDAEAQLSYQYTDLPHLAAEISSLHATYDKFSLNLRGKLAERRFDLAEFSAMEGKESLVSGAGSLPLPEDFADWKALLASKEPWKFTLNTTKLTFEKLNSLIPGATPEKPVIPAKGSVKATLEIAGSPAHPEIHADFVGEALEAKDIKSPVPPTTLAVQLNSREDGKLALTGKITPDGWPAITLDAAVPLDHAKWIDDPPSALDTPVQAHLVVPPLDLALFGPYPAAIKKLAGSFQADITLGGTPNKPALQGSLALKNLVFTPSDERIAPIQKGNIELRLDNTTIHLAALDFQAAGGTLRGSGKIDLADIKKPAFDVQLSGQALPAWRDNSTIVRLDTSLRLAGNLDDATLSGNLAVVQSVFFRDFELIPIGVPFTAPSAPKLPHIDAPKSDTSESTGKKTTFPVPEPFGNWKLDVAFKTADPFLIRGNLVQGDIFAKGRVRGTFANPAPEGTILIKRFEAELPLSRLKINDGKVVLRPDAPLAPELNIRGTSTLRPYQVNVFIHGTAADPKLTFTSNPPLPENEILTLLATGSTSSGLEKKGAATGKLVQVLIEEARRGRLRYVKFLEPALKIFEDVDLQIGETDPYTGRDMNSATLHVTDHWLGSVAIDEQGYSRGIVIFVLRFR